MEKDLFGAVTEIPHLAFGVVVVEKVCIMGLFVAVALIVAVVVAAVAVLTPLARPLLRKAARDAADGQA
jgi:hypothetical protein